MKTSLANAFASCSSFINPRISPSDYEIRIAHRLSLLIITPIPKANSVGLLEHSNFFKVTAPEARPRPVKTRSASPAEGTRRPGAHQRRTGRPKPKVPNYELFKLQQLKYTLLELELPRLLAPDLPSNGSSLRDLDCTHSNYQTRRSPDWVICAPAAFLGCGSRFSGSLSGIEP
ncbi:UNVERIFIED_CONTAM: hypothetical protein Sindi_1692500 [Sesamum indicum]